MQCFVGLIAFTRCWCFDYLSVQQNLIIIEILKGF